METEINLPVKDMNPDMLPALALAYLGDAVYELLVRMMLLDQGLTRVGLLHKDAVQLVRATSQANLLHHIQEWLTEEEIKVMKRGRNAKNTHVPRSAGVVEYRQSTGLESLVGYWFLKKREDRLEKLFTELENLYQG